MCKVIAIVNQKGGVAKTTTTVNLGIGLVREGKKVLLIDADSQGSLSSSLGVAEPDELDVTLSTIMGKVINDEDYGKREGVIVHEEGVSFLPCNIELSGLEVTLVNTMRREYILKEYITSVRNLYDYILIDCNSSLGMVTMNALTAADSVIIPIEAAYLSVKGLQQLITTLGRTKKYLNPNLGIEGIVFTKMVGRTNYAKEIKSMVEEIYGKDWDFVRDTDGNIVVDESHPDWWQDKKNPDRHGIRIPVLDENGVQKVGARNRKQWKRVLTDATGWNNPKNCELSVQCDPTSGSVHGSSHHTVQLHPQ